MPARSLLIVCMAILPAMSAMSQSKGCEVPDAMSPEQKLTCVRAAGILLEQPSITPEQLANGPDFDPAAPEKSRFAYFTAADNVSCYFRPHYAFARVKGDSMKFQCWHMAPGGGFYSRKGSIIPAGQVKVVLEKNQQGETTASLYDSSDAQNQHEIKADHFKVKYLKPPYPNHDTRFNEVFTEVAASRIMWVLGFPSDRVYPVGSVACIGCGEDPFGANLQDNRASLKDTPAIFKVVSAERENSWDTIYSGDDETWSWSDAAKLYGDGEWSRQQKVEYDAYRIALGLIHYHNAIAQQNRLSCAQWEADPPGKTKVCLKPMVYVQDLGSTFGKAKGPLDVFGTNPRGSYEAWEPQTVFQNAGNCELRATLDGDKQVLKEAQDLMIQRLARLDRQTVRSIFQVARFDMMDQKQLQKLHNAKGSPADAALDQWTDTFMKRIEEVRTAKNCKAN